MYDKGGGGRGGPTSSASAFSLNLEDSLGGEGLGGGIKLLGGGSLRLLNWLFLKILYIGVVLLLGLFSSEDSVPGLEAPSESLSVKYPPGESGLGDLL